ncbi:hypothetical protein E4U21_002199 [Claviceps maximensis]|nr:hypothetical protein E4U21_002199 [Claviceps maximensis]
MTGGRIDCYLDIASLFSYVCFEDLWPKLDELAAHGVEVESVVAFHPLLRNSYRDGPCREKERQEDM